LFNFWPRWGSKLCLALSMAGSRCMDCVRQLYYSILSCICARSEHVHHQVPPRQNFVPEVLDLECMILFGVISLHEPRGRRHSISCAVIVPAVLVMYGSHPARIIIDLVKDVTDRCSQMIASISYRLQ
jgi:hypothetical protein